nr:EOG090X0JQ4 [Triops cancriformis]
MVATCGVCQTGTPVYKCPTCGLKYCKSACYKLHKETECQAPQPSHTSPTSEARNSEPETVTYTYPTEDTVPLEKLALLKDNENVKKCLENPHVRQILTSLVNSPNPRTAMQSAMQEPIFMEFADACLNIVENTGFRELK